MQLRQRVALNVQAAGGRRVTLDDVRTARATTVCAGLGRLEELEKVRTAAGDHRVLARATHEGVGPRAAFEGCCGRARATDESDGAAAAQDGDSTADHLVGLNRSVVEYLHGTACNRRAGA